MLLWLKPGHACVPMHASQRVPSLTVFVAAYYYFPPKHAEGIDGDFFSTTLPTELGQFDVIYDCTFLCAILKPQRSAWATQMAALVRPGGELVVHGARFYRSLHSRRV
jgi:hypothetical protein